MSFFRKQKKIERSPEGKRLVCCINDVVASGIFQEILRDNSIPFLCCQPGAGAYFKLLTGHSVDNIYVNEEDFERAAELYHAYFEQQNEDVNEE